MGSVRWAPSKSRAVASGFGVRSPPASSTTSCDASSSTAPRPRCPRVRRWPRSAARPPRWRVPAHVSAVAHQPADPVVEDEVLGVEEVDVEERAPGGRAGELAALEGNAFTMIKFNSA